MRKLLLRHKHSLTFTFPCLRHTRKFARSRLVKRKVLSVTFIDGRRESRQQRKSVKLSEEVKVEHFPTDRQIPQEHSLQISHLLYAVYFSSASLMPCQSLLVTPPRKRCPITESDLSISVFGVCLVKKSLLVAQNERETIETTCGWQTKETNKLT